MEIPVVTRETYDTYRNAGVHRSWGILGIVGIVLLFVGLLIVIAILATSGSEGAASSSPIPSAPVRAPSASPSAPTSAPVAPPDPMSVDFGGYTFAFFKTLENYTGGDPMIVPFPTPDGALVKYDRAHAFSGNTLKLIAERDDSGWYAASRLRLDLAQTVAVPVLSTRLWSVNAKMPQIYDSNGLQLKFDEITAQYAGPVTVTLSLFGSELFTTWNEDDPVTEPECGEVTFAAWSAVNASAPNALKSFEVAVVAASDSHGVSRTFYLEPGAGELDNSFLSYEVKLYNGGEQDTSMVTFTCGSDEKAVHILSDADAGALFSTRDGADRKFCLVIDIGVGGGVTGVTNFKDVYPFIARAELEITQIVAGVAA